MAVGLFNQACHFLLLKKWVDEWKTFEMIQRCAPVSRTPKRVREKIDAMLDRSGTTMAQGESVIYMKAR
ncbi:hypothetical protein RC90_20105 [Pectobacterium brasiliense]|nr:hypothetical protein RC90_20105 [Pectobacterium brasiliense]